MQALLLGSLRGRLGALAARGGPGRPAAGLRGAPTAARALSERAEAGAEAGAGADRRSFGFADVESGEHREKVKGVFRSVAPSYDAMNDFMSFFMHRLWKDHFVRVVQPFPGQRHLDVAGGTGDVAFRMLRGIREAERRAEEQRADALGEYGTVTVYDINPAMLEEGRKRAAKLGLGGEDSGLAWLEGDAEALPFEDGAFDSYTIAFGIRNVTNVDRALAEARRVLKPGGHFCCLEFSEVNNQVLRELYDTYSFSVIPYIGAAVAGDPDSYQYLVESIRKFPKQEEFAGMIRAAGLKAVRYENLFDGMVAVHSGFKL